MHQKFKAPSTRSIPIFFNPQLFLSGYGFRSHASGEFGSESGYFLYVPGRGNFWIRKEKVADSKISGYLWSLWTGPKISVFLFILKSSDKIVEKKFKAVSEILGNQNMHIQGLFDKHKWLKKYHCTGIIICLRADVNERAAKFHIGIFLSLLCHNLEWSGWQWQGVSLHWLFARQKHSPLFSLYPMRLICRASFLGIFKQRKLFWFLLGTERRNCLKKMIGLLIDWFCFWLLTKITETYFYWVILIRIHHISLF